MFGSLRTKLMLSHVGLVLLAMVMLGFYLIRNIDRFYLTTIQGRMRDEAALMSDRIKGDLAAGNRDAVRKYVQDLGATISVRVLVSDADGTILGSSEQEDSTMIGRPGVSRGLSRALRAPEETVIEGVARSTADVVYLLMPVDVDGRRVGAMRLSYQLGDLNSQMQTIETIILAGLAAAVGVALLISLVLAQNLSASARRLAAAARGVASGRPMRRLGMKGKDEIQEAGRAFDAMADRLERLEKARQQLMGDISHDLHSSITGVTMAVEAMQQGAVDDPAMRPLLLGGLASHGRRLHRLADDLLEAARIESGGLQLQRELVDPRQVLGNVAAEFVAEAAQQGVEIELCECADLPALWADGGRIAQALGNLVENAIRYSAQGGVVSLEGQAWGGECRLLVRDQGPGIPPEELDRLFDRFNRYDVARPGRLGFGLAIAKGLVEAHGGRIEVESEIGVGSVFTLVLPVSRGGEDGAADKRPPAAPVLPVSV